MIEDIITGKKIRNSQSSTTIDENAITTEIDEPVRRNPFSCFFNQKMQKADAAAATRSNDSVSTTGHTKFSSNHPGSFPNTTTKKYSTENRRSLTVQNKQATKGNDSNNKSKQYTNNDIEELDRSLESC